MNTTKAHIEHLLRTNDKAVGRALVALHARQTADEQNSEATKMHNGIGFTSADAKMGSSMAKFFQRRGYLSPKQLAYWREPNAKGKERIVKYATQLLQVAKEKGNR